MPDLLRGPCNCTCSLHLLTAQVDEAFDECDLHHDGKIPASELYVAILLLYHRINAMPLGGGLKKPPKR
jgi:hypothetical protein